MVFIVEVFNEINGCFSNKGKYRRRKIKRANMDPQELAQALSNDRKRRAALKLVNTSSVSIKTGQSLILRNDLPPLQLDKEVSVYLFNSFSISHRDNNYR